MRVMPILVWGRLPALRDTLRAPVTGFDAGRAGMDVDARQLRYVAQVAHDLNFTRAPRALFVAQQTLSDAIGQLERQLGVVLLIRTRQQVALTPAGEVFLEHAERIFEQSAAAVHAARAAARAQTSQVAVGFPDWPWAVRLFTLALRRVAADHADVVVRQDPLPWIEHLKAVADGRLDVGVTHVLDEGDLPEHLEGVPLLVEDGGWVLVGEGHPLTEVEEVTARDLAGFPILYQPKDNPWLYANLTRRLQSLGLATHDGDAPPFSSALSHAALGSAMILCTASMTLDIPSWLRRRRVEDLAMAVPEATLAAVVRRRDHTGPIAAVTRSLAAVAREFPAPDWPADQGPLGLSTPGP